MKMKRFSTIVNGSAPGPGVIGFARQQRESPAVPAGGRNGDEALGDAGRRRLR